MEDYLARAVPALRRRSPSRARGIHHSSVDTERLGGSLHRRVRDLFAISAQEQVAMNALMSKGGDLVSMDITERSATVSLGTDRKLQQACVDGFFDRNPPPGAEGPDGNYHFVLRTEVVSIADQSGRRIGYQVTFQAGLL